MDLKAFILKYFQMKFDVKKNVARHAVSYSEC